MHLKIAQFQYLASLAARVGQQGGYPRNTSSSPTDTKCYLFLILSEWHWESPGPQLKG